MAGTPLTYEPNYTTMFIQAMLSNLAYLQQLPEVQSLDAAKLDQERESLVRTIRFALNVSQAWSPVCRLIETVSPYMERRGYWTVWKQILTQALELARQRDDAATGTMLSLLLARLLQRQSNIKQTIYYYRQTLYFARRCGDDYNIARACTNMGYLFIEQGRWLRAEVLCRYALIVFERIGSRHGLAHTENHLGFLYLRKHCWQCAQQHLERACQIWSAMGDDHGLMRGCINLGALYLEIKSPLQAKYYLTQALQRAKATGEEVETAAVYIGLGVACRLEGDPVQGEHYVRQAETIFRRFRHTIGLAQAQDNLGLVYLDQRKWSEAKQYFMTALQNWTHLKSKLGELRVLTYLVEYELARQDQPQAAVRLRQVEAMLKKQRDREHYRFLQPALNRYRYSVSRL
ncbi:MAG: tetratricopeptide repeat protein [Anaerolineae bacterium]|nr:tetratricopeptide repeat protein [Anaerolineae bacterium]